MGSRDTTNTLRGSGKLSGIIFIEDDKVPPSFSANDRCPNCEYPILKDLSPSPNWNPAICTCANQPDDAAHPAQHCQGSSLYWGNYDPTISVIPAYSKDTIANLTAVWLRDIVQASHTNRSPLAACLAIQRQ